MNTPSDRIYHAPYVIGMTIDRPIKVYVQKIRKIGQKDVSEQGITMGDVCVFLDLASCERSIGLSNKAQGGVDFCGKFRSGLMELEVGSEVLKSGTSLWRVMTWSEFRNGYVVDETYGSFRSKADAESVCKAMYEQHRNTLSVKEHLSLGKIGIPESAFVDFDKPNAFKELI